MVLLDNVPAMLIAALLQLRVTGAGTTARLPLPPPTPPNIFFVVVDGKIETLPLAPSRHPPGTLRSSLFVCSDDFAGYNGRASRVVFMR
jgi:hypothetical protein